MNAVVTTDMWTAQIRQLTNGMGRIVSVLGGTKPLCYADAVEAWQSDNAFRTFFISLLNDAPYTAYYWETPPVTRATLDRRFEFVFIDSQSLANVFPDVTTFASYFGSDCEDNDIVGFPNLAGDAFLIAPCPAGPSSAYPHIASFSRQAPLHQQHTLWQTVGRAIEEHVSEQPLWVSTAGLGVFWLHVRLDSRPKYYSYSPYRKFP